MGEVFSGLAPSGLRHRSLAITIVKRTTVISFTNCSDKSFRLTGLSSNLVLFPF